MGDVSDVHYATDGSIHPLHVESDEEVHDEIESVVKDTKGKLSEKGRGRGKGKEEKGNKRGWSTDHNPEDKVIVNQNGDIDSELEAGEEEDDILMFGDESQEGSKIDQYDSGLSMSFD